MLDVQCLVIFPVDLQAKLLHIQVLRPCGKFEFGFDTLRVCYHAYDPMTVRSALQDLKLRSLELECLLFLFLLGHTFLRSEVKHFFIADDG